MKPWKAFLLRLLLYVIPIVGLYIFSQMAIADSRQQEHRTDVGLGIVVVSAFVLAFMSICIVADMLARIVKKEYKIALIDLLFLLPAITFVIYIGCLMASRECFCGWLIDTIGWMR